MFFWRAEFLEVADEVEFSDDDDGKSPLFTLSCVSLNRPPTMVEWYLDGEKLSHVVTTTVLDVIITTVLDNPVTTQYTNTLTVTQRRGGSYKCYVTSDGGFTRTDSATISVQGMFIETGVYLHYYIEDDIILFTR